MSTLVCEMSEDICVLMTRSDKPADPEVVTRRDTRGKIVLHNKLFSRGSLTSRLDVKSVCVCMLEEAGGWAGSLLVPSKETLSRRSRDININKKSKQDFSFSPNLAFRQSCLRLEVATNACPAAATSCVTVSL